MARQPGVHAVFPPGPAMAAAEIDHRPNVHRNAIATPNRFAVDLAEDAGTHQHQITGLDLLFDRSKDGLIDVGIVGFRAKGIGAEHGLTGDLKPEQVGIALQIGRQGGCNQGVDTVKGIAAVKARLQQKIVGMPPTDGKTRHEGLLLWFLEQKGQAAGHADQINRSVEALGEIGDTDPVGIGHRLGELVSEVPMLGIDEAMALCGESDLDLSSIGDRATEIRSLATEEEAFAIAEAHHAEAPTLATCFADLRDELVEGGRIRGPGIGPRGERVADACGGGGIERSSPLSILSSDRGPGLKEGERGARIEGGSQECRTFRGRDLAEQLHQTGLDGGVGVGMEQRGGGAPAGLIPDLGIVLVLSEKQAYQRSNGDRIHTRGQLELKKKARTPGLARRMAVQASQGTLNELGITGAASRFDQGGQVVLVFRRLVENPVPQVGEGFEGGIADPDALIQRGR